MAPLVNPLPPAWHPCGPWCVSGLLHFPISSLLVAWESNGRWSKALGPLTCVGDPGELLAHLWILWSSGEEASRWMTPFSILLSLYKSAFQMKIKKSFLKTYCFGYKILGSDFFFLKSSYIRDVLPLSVWTVKNSSLPLFLSSINDLTFLQVLLRGSPPQPLSSLLYQPLVAT